MSYAHEYIQRLVPLLEAVPETEIAAVAEVIRRGYVEGRQLFFMGNGGSAATASHIVNDFQKCVPPVGGKPYRVMALTDNVPLMLAWANDSEYGAIFEEQLRNWIQPGDIVVGISGSGNSPNVIRAIESANRANAVTIGLCGYDGGKLKQAARMAIHVPTFNMQLAEDVHMVIAHILFSAVRDSFGASDCA